MRALIFLFMEIEQTPIPQDELDIFRSLKDIRVVFDVGARVDTDYIELKPDVELHAFEPNPLFFSELKRKLGDRKKTFLNNFGLSDKAGFALYNEGRQAFEGGDETGFIGGERMLPLKTLDWYVKNNNIKRIDFLKIDTEGYDFKVLLGGKKMLPKCRYIQYEHWNDKEKFHKLLKRFEMKYIGNRNVFCTRRI